MRGEHARRRDGSARELRCFEDELEDGGRGARGAQGGKFGEDGRVGGGGGGGGEEGVVEDDVELGGAVVEGEEGFAGEGSVVAGWWWWGIGSGEKGG